MKPVAWIHPSDLEKLPHEDCWVNGQPSKGDIPLYTKPQYRELSKEEVDELVYEHNLLDDYPYEFVKAVLKKASEK